MFASSVEMSDLLPAETLLYGTYPQLNVMCVETLMEGSEN